MHLMIFRIAFSVAPPSLFLKKKKKEKKIELLIQESNPPRLQTCTADSFYVSHLLECPKASWRDVEPLALENVSISGTEIWSLSGDP